MSIVVRDGDIEQKQEQGLLYYEKKDIIQYLPEIPKISLLRILYLHATLREPDT